MKEFLLLRNLWTKFTKLTSLTNITTLTNPISYRRIHDVEIYRVCVLC
jgi:hypothetical protein